VKTTRLKIRKIKSRNTKFFGWPEDNWARLGGRWGRRGTYGRWLGMAHWRTRAEIHNADERKDAQAMIDGEV
jgi:hypothetical protein